MENTENTENSTQKVESQAFLQWLIARRSVTLDETKSILTDIKRIANPDAPLTNQQEALDALDRAHVEFEPFGLDVVEWRDELQDERRWMLVNKTAGYIAHKATGYTADEIGYFRAILSAIFESSSDYSWQKNLGYRDLNVEKQLPRQDVDKLVQRLVDDSWLAERNNKIYIGPRTYVELKPYLNETFGDLLYTCRGCDELFTRGKQCSTDRCPVRLHLKCERAFYARNGGKACPDCGQDLLSAKLIGV